MMSVVQVDIRIIFGEGNGTLDIIFITFQKLKLIQNKLNIFKIYPKLQKLKFV